jgi:hydroxypyruvate isomerase
MRTIRDCHPYFSHYHTAGNPGRHEINETQEVQYTPIMHTIAQTGFQGFVGQEFIPQSDPITALKHAFELCNVSL